MPEPAFGEKNAHSLIAALPGIRKIAKHPHVQFIREIEKGGLDRSELAEPLGEIFHERRTIAKPQLGSFFLLAGFFDVDVALLLTDPKLAARQCDLGFPVRMPRNAHKRIPRTRQERKEAIGRALLEAIKGHPPYPSLAAFSRDHNIHRDTVLRVFPALSRELMRTRFRWIEESRSCQSKAIESSLKRIRSRGYRTLTKEDIRRVALRCSSSICQVREAWRQLSTPD